MTDNRDLTLRFDFYLFVCLFVCSLNRKRKRLEILLSENKNRKWSILLALKDVMASISSRFRRDSKTGLNLENLVQQMQTHEVRRRKHVPGETNSITCQLILVCFPKVLMSDVASLEPPADDVRSASDQVLQSGLLDPGQSRKVQERMHELNGRWNTLNVNVIEKEMRLVFSVFIF